MSMKSLPRICLYSSLFLLISGIGLAGYGIAYHDDIMGSVAEMPPHFALGVNLIFLGLFGAMTSGITIYLQKRKQRASI